MSSNLLQLRQRFERLRLAHSRLLGVRAAAQAREAELTLKVGHAKGRLSLVEEADAALEGLQKIAHDRSVGLFERLLSAVISDVFPDKGAVALELGTERGQPALDVKIHNGEALEDAKDSGGAVTNILSAGLRFAALSRTQNRRFMVLDEPDCWLKPSLLPAFIQVLTQIVEETQTQIILVSHHDLSYFEGLVNLVQVVQGAEGTEAHSLEPRVSNWEDEDTPGIRTIRIVNFRTYKDALIPFSPGITALIGENDLGKSHAAEGALRAVAYGESDDTDIRHGESEARIIITFEHSRRIEWTRRRTGSPRVSYALYEGETLVHEGRQPGRGQAPEWVTKALGISRVNNLDIQIGSQKQPVFLLNEVPSVRAQLLSVGRESERLHDLIESYGDLKRKDREQVREGETEVTELRRRINGSAVLPTLEEPFNALAGKLAVLEAHSARIAQIGKLLARVDAIEKRLARFAAETQALKGLRTDVPQIKDLRTLALLIERIEHSSRIAAVKRDFPAVSEPAVKDLRSLASLIQRIERASKVAGIKCEFPHVSEPSLKDLHRLRELGTRIARLTARAAVKPLPALPSLPQVKDTASIGRIGSVLSARAAEHSEALRRVATVQTERAAAQKEMEALIESLGGLCPTCNGPLPEDLSQAGHEHQLESAA